MWMTRVSINHPVFATMVMVALTVLGLFSYNRLGVEPMPDVTPPVVTVRVDYPGASPEQVENDIAKPVENAINTVAGVKMIRSVSFEGLVWTMVEFRLDVDQTRVLQEVRDKLAQIRANFPRDAKDPIVSRGDTENDQPVASFALVADGLTQRELSNLAEQVVQKRFERVSGVGRVALGGLVTREVQVRVNPERLTAFGLSVDQVVSAVRAANVSVPVGLITNANSESIVRVDGRMTDPAAFNRIIVARKSGVPIYLSQVADVADSERERSSYSRINGKPSIGVWVFKAQDANIVDVGQRVKAAAQDMKKLLPAAAELQFLWASADWVKNSLDNVKTTIVEGALLTILIVFLFLGSWRSTVITGLTLPIAVIATFIALYAFGFTLNYMTMMALSLCIGLLIDDAIVVRENIVRHLHMGKDHYTAAREGTEEIGLAVLATTFSIVAVFVPIAFMSGIVGKFFYPFGITVAVAVLVSLFVSFTLDPMLSAVWHDPPEGARRTRFIGPVLAAFERLIDRVHVVYGRLLAGRCRSGATAGAAAAAPRSAPRHSDDHPLRALRERLRRARPGLGDLDAARHDAGAALLSFAVSLPIAGMVGSEMMPEADQSFTSVRLTAPVGSSLEYTNERVRRVEEALADFKEIRFLDTQVGNEGKNTARINLRLVPRSERSRSQKQLEQAVRERIARIPGVDMRVGWGGPIYVALLGNNDAEMARVMRDVKEQIGKIRGIRDVEITVKEGTPALSVRLKPEIAAEYGLTHAQLGTTLRALVAGESAGVLARAGRAELRRDDPVAARQPHRRRRRRQPQHPDRAPDVGRLARDGAVAGDRDDRPDVQSGEHPPPGPAASRRAVRQRRRTPLGRRRQGGARADRVLPAARGPAIRHRRPVAGAAGDQQRDRRCADARGGVHLPGARLAVRQLPAAGGHHGLAAAVDRRRDAGPAGHEDDAQHLLDDRHRVPHGPGDEERDPAGGLREQGTARGQEPGPGAARCRDRCGCGRS